MAIHLKRTLIIFAILMIIMQISRGQRDEPPPAESEEDDSSSEETQEESNNESHKRRRRSLESSAEATEGSSMQAKAGLPSIPGLPDPETILKIAEVLTTVGQEVLPILATGNSGVAGLVQNRKSHDMNFLKRFKNELEFLSGELKKSSEKKTEIL